MNIGQKFMMLGVMTLIVIPSTVFASQQCDGLTAVAGGGACDDKALTDKLNTIIDTLFIVVGAIAVLIIVMGGIRYITSTGDAKRIQAAKDTLLFAIVGLIVVILARAIVGFVVGKVA